MWATPPARSISRLGFLELVDRARDEQHGRPRVGDLDGSRFADPRRGAGDQHDLPPHRGRERAVLEQVGVEVALPVVPDPVGVALQRRHLDPRAGERLLRPGRVEAGRVVDVVEHPGRNAGAVERQLQRPLAGREEAQPGAGEARHRVGEAGVELHRGLRRVGGAGEQVEHLAGGLRLRVGEAEGLSVEAGLVGDVVDRRGDVVDRDDVDLAPLDPDRRQPGRQHTAHLLQQLEHVVGAVDLVDLARARVADDDPRPVDAPGAAAFLAHDPLRLVLGAEVRMRVEVLGLVEHVLGPGALVEAGGGDRADLVEAAGLDRAGEFDRVARPLDVGDLLSVGAGGHVVDRRQVEEVVDLAAQRHQILLGDPEAGLREVAGDRHDPRPVGSPGGPQLLQAPPRTRPDERVDGALALQQTGDEVAADESGGSRDEVVHRSFIHSFERWRKRPPCR